MLKRDVLLVYAAVRYDMSLKGLFTMSELVALNAKERMLLCDRLSPYMLPEEANVSEVVRDSLSEWFHLMSALSVSVMRLSLSSALRLSPMVRVVLSPTGE